MYKYKRRKEFIKNTVYITFILLLAVISTYYIYDKFQDVRSIDFNSDSLDVTYHEASGDKVSIRKITPVTDSVGLSSKSYILSINNNLTEKVNYKIKLVDDINTINKDVCGEFLIPKEDIKVSIKVNKGENEIYNLNELENGVLLENKIKALDTDEVSIRLWIRQDSSLLSGSEMHYHGVIQVVEDDDSVAINR